MTLAQTYSWIFYAAALASAKEPAKNRSIEQVADAINHAVPTNNEMQKSLSWCVAEGLLLKEGKGYVLTDQGRKLLSECSENVRTSMGVWKNIEEYISKNGVDNIANISPATLAT